MQDPRTSFREILNKFLVNLGEVYEEDSRIPIVQKKINEIDIDVLMKSFHDEIKPFENELKAHDVELLEKIEYLKTIDMHAKYIDPDFDEDSKNSFWLYVEKLYSFSVLNNAIPSSMKNDIFSLADEVKKSGDISLAFTKAKEMAENISEDESKEIMASMKGLMDQIPPEVIQNVLGNPQFSALIKSQGIEEEPQEILNKIQTMFKK